MALDDTMEQIHLNSGAMLSQLKTVTNSVNFGLISQLKKQLTVLQATAQKELSSVSNNYKSRALRVTSAIASLNLSKLQTELENTMRAITVISKNAYDLAETIGRNS